ncbi:MAG TPA: galactose-1-phosphate uridylyltransferase [Candidatus Latescibacteria bacterium]|nr:galactose-1-phosphate uridylyltransferase [Candidatus Latescibacterota bacterium]
MSGFRKNSVAYSPKQWEMRWHPIRKEWVGFAAHRNTRPWQGEQAPQPPPPPPFDPTCYLCPGNTRNRGERNPDYSGTFVFDNDFPPFGPDAPETTTEHGLYKAMPAYGRCRVVCFHPRHDLTLAEMNREDIRRVVETWQAEHRMLAKDSRINHVLIFENKGSVVGVSNPHPHGQIYATEFVPPVTVTELASSREFYAEKRRTLVGAILEQELRDEVRVIAQNDTSVAFIPYFARYAHETYIVPRRPMPSVADLTPDEADDFTEILHTMLVKFDNLYGISFPYVMAFHQAPTDGAAHPEYHFHVEFHPPLRYPGVLKYLAGAETGAGVFLNDTSPEEKAKEFRAAGNIHYKATGGQKTA